MTVVISKFNIVESMSRKGLFGMQSLNLIWYFDNSSIKTRNQVLSETRFDILEHKVKLPTCLKFP